jgi:hypothetical protein
VIRAVRATPEFNHDLAHATVRIPEISSYLENGPARVLSRPNFAEQFPPAPGFPGRQVLPFHPPWGDGHLPYLVIFRIEDDAIVLERMVPGAAPTNDRRFP